MKSLSIEGVVCVDGCEYAVEDCVAHSAILDSDGCLVANVALYDSTETLVVSYYSAQTYVGGTDVSDLYHSASHEDIVRWVVCTHPYY